MRELGAAGLNAMPDGDLSGTNSDVSLNVVGTTPIRALVSLQEAPGEATRD
jgi:hypothetical protein